MGVYTFIGQAPYTSQSSKADAVGSIFRLLQNSTFKGGSSILFYLNLSGLLYDGKSIDNISFQVSDTEWSSADVEDGDTFISDTVRVAWSDSTETDMLIGDFVNVCRVAIGFNEHAFTFENDIFSEQNWGVFGKYLPRQSFNSEMIGDFAHYPYLNLDTCGGVADSHDASMPCELKAHVTLLAQEDTTVTANLAKFPADALEPYEIIHTYDEIELTGDGAWHDYWLDLVTLDIEAGSRLGFVFQWTAMLIPALSNTFSLWTAGAGEES